MDTKPAFGFKELFTYIVGDMAKAICQRNGGSQQQQFLRSQAAVHMIMGFLPRDVIEAMLAGHCVMFHELMTDSVRDTLRGEVDTMRRATRSSIVAMDKAFGNNINRLERYQLRPSEGRRDAPDALPAEAPMAVVMQAAMEPQAEQPIVRENGDRTGQPASRTESRPVPQQAVPARMAPVASPELLGEQPSSSVTETKAIFTPSPEAIAACLANPEAMAALNAGDPERFARAMGIDMPAEAYLAAAATPGSIFDRQAAGTPPQDQAPANGPGGIDIGLGGIVRVARDGPPNSGAD